MITHPGFLPATLARRSAALLAALLLAGPAAANDGRFEIVSAGARVDAEVWLVDARVDLELSDAAVEALESGVRLQIQYQYELTRNRRFWVDEVMVEQQQNIELQYLSLSQRYVVRWLDTGEQASYATLFSALRYMGLVRDYRLQADMPAVADDGLEFGMRAVLVRETLPGPLQVLAFWREDLSLESDWYRWQAR